MSHIFISYSHKDSEYAHKLADALKEAGFEVWIDGRIDYGTAWPRVIQENLDTSGAFIVVMTPRSYDSDWVQNELNRAKRKRIPIFPLLLEGDEPWLSVEALQYVDVRSGTLPPPRFFMELGRVPGLGIVSDAPPPAPPADSPLPAQRSGEGLGVRATAKLPAPFAWVEIPKKGYSIAKYPVTNAQFAKFVEAGGYGEKRWWTAEGWQKRQEGWHYDGGWKPSGTSWTEPRYWRDSQWNGTEQPVVGVSWFEAVAFCLWLSDVTGKNIMLPTEDQWQYAAQGDDGRTYPWGNDWDCKRCNNSVKPCDSHVTTPVTQYEGRRKGDSPFGVVDMAGNVWEWCLTDYDNKTNDVNRSANTRVLRGGSWFVKNTDYFRCDYRGRNAPHVGGGSPRPLLTVL